MTHAVPIPDKLDCAPLHPNEPQHPRHSRHRRQNGMEQHQRSITCDNIDWETFVQICIAEKVIVADKLGDFVRATVDGQTLSPSVEAKPVSQTMKQRLEAMRRAMERQLHLDHAARMARLDEEVRRRVLAEGKEYLDYLHKERAEARKAEALYHEMANRQATMPLTQEEFAILRKVIHPDNSASTETRAKAFHILTEKKARLVQP